jgi:hypothetical protein
MGLLGDAIKKNAESFPAFFKQAMITAQGIEPMVIGSVRIKSAKTTNRFK